MSHPNGLSRDHFHGNDLLLRRSNSKWWNGRWVLKFVSKIIAALAILHCIFLTIGTVVVESAGIKSAGKHDYSCQSRGCHREASRIRNYMDETVDPCENFYQFACGGFINSTIIQAYESSSTMWSINQDTINEQLRKMIESESNDRSKERKAFGLVKKLYKSCMNTTAIENKGLKPLNKLLKKWGGWSLIDDERSNDCNIDGFVYRSVIDISLEKDIKNNTIRVLQLDRPNEGISEEYLRNGLDDKVVQAYHGYMTDIAVFLGADRDRASNELEKVLRFEMALANIYPHEDNTRDLLKSYNPMSVGELAEKYPSVPWKDYFAQEVSSTMPIDEIVVVRSPRYLEGLIELMNVTTKEVQTNFAMWRLVEKHLAYLNDDVRERQLVFHTAMNGKTKREDRSTECVKMVTEKLSVSLGAMYVKKYFHREAKKNVDEMVMEIKKQFNEMLKQVGWLDYNTRKNAIEKLKAMSADIAYPHELLDDEKIDAFYDGLEFSEDNYFENILNHAKFDVARTFSGYRRPNGENPLNPLGWQTEANAYYSFFKNRIVLPASVLQGVFFSDDRPSYMNYGAVGSIIGHEMSHGFDDTGRNFDEKGNFVDRWDPLTNEKHRKQVECIAEQYGNYEDEETGLKLDGTSSRDENFADNWGLKAAHLAYRDWTEKNGPEPKLPDVDYTAKQLFWISNAHKSCSKYTRKLLTSIIEMGDAHLPDEYRVIGSLSNSPEFSDDFNCPIGSRMNPVKKCTLG